MKTKTYTIFASFPMHETDEEKQNGYLEVLTQLATDWFTACKTYGAVETEGYDAVLVISNMDATGDASDGRLHYLGQAITKLDKADAVIFTDDWSRHKGCFIEHITASIYGIPIVNERHQELYKLWLESNFTKEA